VTKIGQPCPPCPRRGHLHACEPAEGRGGLASRKLGAPPCVKKEAWWARVLSTERLSCRPASSSCSFFLPGNNMSNESSSRGRWPCDMANWQAGTIPLSVHTGTSSHHCLPRPRSLCASVRVPQAPDTPTNHNALPTRTRKGNTDESTPLRTHAKPWLEETSRQFSSHPLRRPTLAPHTPQGPHIHALQPSYMAVRPSE
jgi:hypothetical protein